MKAALLLTLLVALGATLAWEFRHGAAPGAGAPSIAGRRAPASPATLATTDPGRREQWVKTILARPLFAQTRRPQAEARVAQAAAPTPTLPRLAGTVVAGNSKRVIFAGAGEGRPTVVAEGGTVNGFRIELIEPGRVIVVGPGGPRTLLTSFDPNRPVPASPAAPPPSFPGLPSILPPANPVIPAPGSLALPPGSPPTVFPPPVDLSGGLQIPGLPLARAKP